MQLCWIFVMHSRLRLLASQETVVSGAFISLFVSIPLNQKRMAAATTHNSFSVIYENSVCMSLDCGAYVTITFSSDNHLYQSHWSWRHRKLQKSSKTARGESGTPRVYQTGLRRSGLNLEFHISRWKIYIFRQLVTFDSHLLSKTGWILFFNFRLQKFVFSALSTDYVVDDIYS